jgi:NAD(P)-dependent dehydrogenase (short-subunit alcohol dehydrogenase family)
MTTLAQPRAPAARVLEGRVGIVTGASRGIGAAAARAFAAAGARVVLAARDASALDALRGELFDSGAEAMAVATDVTDRTSVERLVEAAAAWCGRLDFAFNNAGEGHRPMPLADLDVATFRRTIDINLLSIFLCLRAELPVMVTAGGGAIVNMASSAGLTGAPGMAAYAAAKHALVGLTEVAAIDYAGAGVRVNALAPGPIASHPDMNAAIRGQIGRLVPLGRMGRPEEVAAAAVWLCSDAASFITGTTLRIDGGKLSGAAANG